MELVERPHAGEPLRYLVVEDVANVLVDLVHQLGHWRGAVRGDGTIATGDGKVLKNVNSSG